MKIRKFAGKKTVLLSAGILALSLAASTSFAGTPKLQVQDASGTNTVFSVDDTGQMGINVPTPNYAADVANNGGISQSELHFAKDGSDSGGWLTSVLENNFFISSGAAVVNGQWIQKASSGKSVFFGSGDAGFRAYLNQGNTVGQQLTNINQVMLVDYSGNLTMNGGIQMNNGTATQPACSATTEGMLWMTKGTTDTVSICAKKSGTLGWYSLSF